MGGVVERSADDEPTAEKSGGGRSDSERDSEILSGDVTAE